MWREIVFIVGTVLALFFFFLIKYFERVDEEEYINLKKMSDNELYREYLKIKENKKPYKNIDRFRKILSVMAGRWINERILKGKFK